MNAKVALLAAVALTSLGACSSGKPDSLSGSGRTSFPSGEIVSKTIDCAEFRGIDASNAVKVVYTQSPSVKVELRGPSDVLEHASVAVRGKILHVGLDSSSNFSFRGDDSHLWVYVSAPSVSGFDTSSAASITVSDAYSCPGGVKIDVSSAGSVEFASLVAPDVDIESSSAGQVTVGSLRATTLSVEASSASLVTLAGEASTADFEASSSASVRASDLKVKTGSASASSTATVKCAIKTVEIKESSFGTVHNSK